MTSTTHTPRVSWIPFLLTGALLTGCSGGGTSSSNLSSSDDFALLTVSVVNGQVWQINRPIRFTFNQAVDFDTVTRNTISVFREDGLPAVGDFSLDPTEVDPVHGGSRTVIFTPVCPTVSDFSDGGFQPDGIGYRIDIPDVRTSTAPLRSLRTGKGLQTGGRTLEFQTAYSTTLAELFLDEVLGPPVPLLSPGNEVACRIERVDGETGELITEEFTRQDDGSGELENGSLVPNNFYSAVDTQITIYLEFNQPVSPTVDNISASRLRLEYQTLLGEWISLPTELELAANCTSTGATVRMQPIGILPQDRPMRVVVTAQFEDLVGDRNIVDLDRFALMHTAAQLDHEGNPADSADEFLEPFNPFDNRFEDVTAALDAPRGEWGNETTGAEGLQAAFAFNGTGGINGEFDLKIRTGTEVVFDTTSTLFIGGPNFSPQYSQLSVGGRLDVRHLLVEEGGILRCQGPNPVRILASGNVVVRGTISCDGSSAAPVFTLDTPNQPESGAAGQCGGGDGGTGSYLTTQVTPKGQAGYGAFQVAGLGGEGGESGYNSSSAGSARRTAGGGGGRLGPDMLHYGDDGVTICAYEWAQGLNAESGFPGMDTAVSSQGAHIPYGGHIGPSPFNEAFGTIDDFYGTKRANFGTALEELVVGELPKPWAGAGGGAGGDATQTDTYPPTEFIYSKQDKGAGGGGGAGAITVLALGSIVFEDMGTITAIGGHGSGGENTGGVDRIGGGSGGGSGGHIILQAGQKVDFSGAFLGGESGVTRPEQLFHSVNARGGQGGAGASNAGGADGSETPLRKADAKHRGTSTPANPDDNPWIPLVPDTCVNYITTLLGSGHKWVIRAAGGDGSPGLVQIHVGNLSGLPSEHDVVYPDDDILNMRDLCWPAPHGFDELEYQWVDQLLPSFGRFSKTQSAWIPLGAASVVPGPTPKALTFLFDVIDTSTGLGGRQPPRGRRLPRRDAHRLDRRGRRRCGRPGHAGASVLLDPNQRHRGLPPRHVGDQDRVPGDRGECPGRSRRAERVPGSGLLGDRDRRPEREHRLPLHPLPRDLRHRPGGRAGHLDASAGARVPPAALRVLIESVRAPGIRPSGRIPTRFSAAPPRPGGGRRTSPRSRRGRTRSSCTSGSRSRSRSSRAPRRRSAARRSTPAPRG